jgi:hypothetical protein
MAKKPDPQPTDENPQVPPALPADDDVSADLGSSDFLKQADFTDGGGQVFTIARVEKRTFEARDGLPADSRWVVTFEGGRCLGLNKTNLRLLAKWFGKHARGWIGKDVAIYIDESVSYAGRLTGGLRVRKPTRDDKNVEAVDDIVPF